MGARFVHDTAQYAACLDPTPTKAYVLAYASWGLIGMESERRARLFRNGRNQALRIPREFELDSDEVFIRKEGSRLIVEPVERRSLLALLASLSPLEDDFPDVDEGLLAPDDVEL